MRVLDLDGATLNVDKIERYYYDSTLDAVVLVFVSGTKLPTSYKSVADFEDELYTQCRMIP